VRIDPYTQWRSGPLNASTKPPPPEETPTGDLSSGDDGGGYWRQNIRLVLILLSVWFVVSCGFGVLLVVPLNRFHFGGFPLGFWFAQQGSIFVFVILIYIYARRMDRLDREYGGDEPPLPPSPGSDAKPPSVSEDGKG
jgi:putative solute:sodium symporter small subunit